MGYVLKTKETDRSVIEFINMIHDEKKREDAFRLLDLFSQTTGCEAKMWGKSIIGFGSYHYKYASGHEGDAPITGFSPRKEKFSLYLFSEDPNREELLNSLGKHKQGKGCVYINKLIDIDSEVLQKLIKQTVLEIKATYPELT